MGENKERHDATHAPCPSPQAAPGDGPCSLFARVRSLIPGAGPGDSGRLSHVFSNLKIPDSPARHSLPTSPKH